MSAEAAGITTTVPIEVLYAAGRLPVDLNNRFIAGPDPHADVERAERNGFPRALCAWTKGLYGALHRLGLRRVVGVTRGDCSETRALLEIWESEGVEVIPFAYPERPDPAGMAVELAAFCARLGVTMEEAEAEKKRLDAARAPAHALDRRAAVSTSVPSRLLFESLLNCSDFEGNPEAHAERCRRALAELEATGAEEEARPGPRLGLLGVPPIYSDLLETLEARGARVAFCEMPRQFALPLPERSLAGSYAAYTYPYGAAARVEDIEREARARRLDGLIHYVQSFCHRQIHDRLLRERLDLPLLTLEGDRPGPVDAAALTRIEAFLELFE